MPGTTRWFAFAGEAGTHMNEQWTPRMSNYATSWLKEGMRMRPRARFCAWRALPQTLMPPVQAASPPARLTPPPPPRAFVWAVQPPGRWQATLSTACWDEECHVSNPVRVCACMYPQGGGQGLHLPAPSPCTLCERLCEAHYPRSLRRHHCASQSPRLDHGPLRHSRRQCSQQFPRAPCGLQMA